MRERSRAVIAADHRDPTAVAVRSELRLVGKATDGGASGAVTESAEAVTHLELGARCVTLADPAVLGVFALLERLAGSMLPVLISGETGVGKENAAYAVHHWSKRTGRFVAVNCAAIGPESLVESELFGHDKGAFTGAVAVRPGLFESAFGGTVFLDEVGELPIEIQAKLLRTLETKRIVRLGETIDRPIDIRLVAATNRSLEDEVKAGRFRRDLYFRLSAAPVVLPPLRDRRSDIATLAREFLAAACAQVNRGPMSITPAAMQALLSYPWPGNVRELKNAMEFVTAAALEDLVDLHDLPGGLREATPVLPPRLERSPIAADAAPKFRPIADELRELERRRMAEALVAAKGVRRHAARLIDMPSRTFTFKMKQYKL
jgi:DNA-binding NtrC family response regulator